MKEKYITPDVQMLQLHTEDVITDSPAITLVEGDGSLDFFEFPC